MVSYSERRHRLNPVEVDPVKEAVHFYLLRLLEERQDLLTASIPFRAFYRIDAYCKKNKPSYPPHDTWEEIGNYPGLRYHKSGTVSPVDRAPETLQTEAMEGARQ